MPDAMVSGLCDVKYDMDERIDECSPVGWVLWKE